MDPSKTNVENKYDDPHDSGALLDGALINLRNAGHFGQIFGNLATIS
jgi:hypothetical protein